MHDALEGVRPRSRRRTTSRVPVALRLSSFFALAIAATFATAFALQAVDAATYQGPSAQAPGGNIPAPIWNRYGISGGQQTSTTFNIDANGIDPGTGQGTKGIGIGSDALSIGATQNLIYGNVDTTSTGALLLLQTESANRLRVDTAGNLEAAGKITATSLRVTGGPPATGQALVAADALGNLTWGSSGGACSSGRAYVGRTPATYDGNLDGVNTGYLNADALCNAAFAGSKVCSVEEVMNSYKCAVTAVTSATGATWVNQGPPGYTANANDCKGWKSDDGTSASKYYGRVWNYASNGGEGAMTPCNAPLSFACCR